MSMELPPEIVTLMESKAIAGDVKAKSDAEAVTLTKANEERPSRRRNVGAVAKIFASLTRAEKNIADPMPALVPASLESIMRSKLFVSSVTLQPTSPRLTAGHRSTRS
jgi:hypothetical protein